VTIVWTLGETTTRLVDAVWDAKRVELFIFDASEVANDDDVKVDVTVESTLFAEPRKGMSFEADKVTCKEL